MPLDCYLAMTAGEYEGAQTLPDHIGWMACHFSCYGLGLSNLPRNLPEGAMVILNDRTPVCKHDPQRILEELNDLLQALKPSRFLLDFQRPGQEQTQLIARVLSEELSCPVGVSEQYAKELNCPVFLSSPPLHVNLKEYLQPWQGRTIWLEAVLDTETITVTREGSSFSQETVQELDVPFFEETDLHCNYHIHIREDAAVFTLQRDREQLGRLLDEAQESGVELAVGLYQQLG